MFILVTGKVILVTKSEDAEDADEASRDPIQAMGGVAKKVGVTEEEGDENQTTEIVEKCGQASAENRFLMNVQCAPPSVGSSSSIGSCTCKAPCVDQSLHVMKLMQSLSFIPCHPMKCGASVPIPVDDRLEQSTSLAS